MKIEKKIVKNSTKLSIAAKSAIAASLGIAAVALTACEESGTAAAPDQTNLENPETGAPENETPSSSSVVDIPLSHEALSSSAVEALSSAAEPLSSSSFEEPYPPPEAGTIAAPTDDDIYGPNSSSSSDEEAQSSSAEEPVPLAGDPIFIDDSLSSVNSSNSEDPASSSSFNRYQGECPNGPASPDCNVRLCVDPDGPCNLIVSMVTTYEPGDIRT
ncbi:hypothetical protein SAMN05720473_101435 [Fibrobacter sp. UWB15]|uniref:hypothetical protein n=1 Tax=unclassified Fibrobacter TaxID=2634177 RepID=UPI0009172F3D|nr:MULTISPECIES: hypothetical protein [unclassified Fibrobacter]PWJ67562.1 hypothetical protein BGW99_101435 [Fibrobacter sp. UWB6]SHF71035.1 hypothetical protein SAMN05720760_101400 [Fibrobacter sp. UWB8]SMG12399.1 hypothetical protein SAMN05720473_101435 [Fibrobacter sp. UWB15]